MNTDKPWYDQDEFWAATAPVLFHQRRWDKAPEEIDCVISLLGMAPGSRILDLCCGPGRHSLELARRGYKVTGVDRTTLYLEEANARAKKENLEIEFVNELPMTATGKIMRKELKNLEIERKSKAQ